MKEKQGVDFLDWSRLYGRGDHDDCPEESALTVYEDDGSRRDQRRDYDYNRHESAQSSPGHQDWSLVDDQWWPNCSSSTVSEFSDDLMRPDSPTINLDEQSRIFRGHSSRTCLSPIAARVGSTVDSDWPLPNTPFDNTIVDISERREGIHHSFHRQARFREEFDSHGYQHDVDIPEGPYFMLGPDTGRRDQRSAYHQGPRGYTVFESYASGNHLHQNLDHQSYQHQMALDDSLQYQLATAGLAHQADGAISLDSLLVNEEQEHEAISCSNSAPGQGPLESSQNVHQDTIHAPDPSAELVHDQGGDLTREEPGTLPLHDEFGAYEQSKLCRLWYRMWAQAGLTK